MLAVDDYMVPRDSGANAVLPATEYVTATSDLSNNANLADIVHPHKNVAPALCVFFDLETTGLNTQHAEVIEIAAVSRLMLPDGSWYQGGRQPQHFRMLVRPSKLIPQSISRLTGITNEDVEKHGTTFHMAMSAWQVWIRQQLDIASATVAGKDDVRCGCCDHPVELWLVGHNVINYDIRVLASEDFRHHRQEVHDSCVLPKRRNLFEGLSLFIGLADTLRMARAVTRTRKHDWGCGRAPGSHKLGCLHRFILGKSLEGAHTALGDSIGVAELCARRPLQQALHAAIQCGHATSNCTKRNGFAPAGLPLSEALSAYNLSLGIESNVVRLRRFSIQHKTNRRLRRNSIASSMGQPAKRTLQHREAGACSNLGTMDGGGQGEGRGEEELVTKKARMITGNQVSRRRRWRRGLLIQWSAGCLKDLSFAQLADCSKLASDPFYAFCFKSLQKGSDVIDIDV